MPPPAGATLSNITAAARPSCARSWRRAGDGAVLDLLERGPMVVGDFRDDPQPTWHARYEAMRAGLIAEEGRS